MSCNGCRLRLPGECLYYSGEYLSESEITSGDNFNVIVKKLNDLLSVMAGGESPNTKTDTNSIALTLSGANNRNISAAVKLSSISGNLIQETTNGLYVVGANLGITGARVFAGLQSSQVSFRRIIGTSGKIVVTENANDIQIDIDPLFSPGGGGASSLTGNLFS